jgi:hypothetical protein
VSVSEDDDDYNNYNNDVDEEDGDNNYQQNHFMNSAAKDSVWLAVARPEIYTAIYRIKYVYADTKAVIAYRYDTGHLIIIRLADQPVGYMAKTVGWLRKIGHMFDMDTFDKIANIMVKRDGQDE